MHVQIAHDMYSFLAATEQLYIWLCRSVGQSVSLCTLAFSHDNSSKNWPMVTKFGVHIHQDKGLEEFWHGWPWPKWFNHKKSGLVFYSVKANFGHLLVCEKMWPPAQTNVSTIKFWGPEHFTSVIPSGSEVYRMHSMLNSAFGTQVLASIANFPHISPF